MLVRSETVPAVPLVYILSPSTELSPEYGDGCMQGSSQTFQWPTFPAGAHAFVGDTTHFCPVKALLGPIHFHSEWQLLIVYF